MENGAQCIFESYCEAKKIPLEQIGKILLTEEQVVCHESTFEDRHIKVRYNLCEPIDNMAKKVWTVVVRKNTLFFIRKF